MTAQTEATTETTAKPTAPRKPRAPKAAPAKTTPAKAKETKPAPAPKPEPEKPAKINKFAGKQELSRLCILALDGLIAGLTKEQLAEIGMSRDEAAKVTANRIHHFGTGGEWPAKTMPKPDRSDWR